MISVMTESVEGCMENLNENFKKAIYLGVGLASYAAEQATQAVSDIQAKQEELRGFTEDLIRRGETTANDTSSWLGQINQWVPGQRSGNGTQQTDQPQKIEIVSIEDVDHPEDSSEL
jgi:polyhydroxyalkanoate synthesis regulator phasin